MTKRILFTIVPMVFLSGGCADAQSNDVGSLETQVAAQEQSVSDLADDSGDLLTVTDENNNYAEMSRIELTAEIEKLEAQAALVREKVSELEESEATSKELYMVRRQLRPVREALLAAEKAETAAEKAETAAAKKGTETACVLAGMDKDC